METPEQQHLHPYKTTIIQIDIFFVFSRAYLAASPSFDFYYFFYSFSTFMKTKTQKKKAEKVIEDRTFGLKNKNKSKAVQKYVKGVEQTVKFAGVSMSLLEAQQFEKKKQKKKEQQEKALLNSLYNDVNRLKEEEEQEEDPANIVCPYFKQGLCQKGKKCIYSHDLTLDRTEEIDLYVDQRTQLIMNAIGGKQLGSLSEEELGKLIGEKEREYIKGCRSDIVCKFFLEAVEKEKYGWNWTCPNGGDKCKYKHCLPPGYKLKRDIGSSAQEEKVDIEEKIDQERNRLLAQNKSSPLVTYEVFLKWKEDRRIKKEAEMVKKKAEEEKKNKNKGQLRTGRQLFSIDPNLFVDDQEAAADYEQQEIIEEPEEDNGEKLYEDDEEIEGEKREREEQTQNEQQDA